MKYIAILIIFIMTISISQASDANISCVGDLETVNTEKWPGVKRISITYLNGIIRVSIIDKRGFKTVSGRSEPELVGESLVIMATKNNQESGITFDLLTFEGEVILKDEFLSNIKCNYIM